MLDTFLSLTGEVLERTETFRRNVNKTASVLEVETRQRNEDVDRIIHFVMVISHLVKGEWQRFYSLGVNCQGPSKLPPPRSGPFRAPSFRGQRREATGNFNFTSPHGRTVIGAATTSEKRNCEMYNSETF